MKIAFGSKNISIIGFNGYLLPAPFICKKRFYDGVYLYLGLSFNNRSYYMSVYKPYKRKYESNVFNIR